MSRAKTDSPGRLYNGPPLAVVDIGSNSVRLVVYERLSRSPTALFNEKALCGLGREVQTTRLTTRQRQILQQLGFDTPAQILSHHLPRAP